MVVCVEAGLTVDGAMQRVGTDLAIAHPSLSRELNIAHMETAGGAFPRRIVEKPRAGRTGNAALQSLATMLIQADRFGTSVATALRVHADTFRTTRQFAAEESAAKASVKLTFPLVLLFSRRRSSCWPGRPSSAHGKRIDEINAGKSAPETPKKQET